MAKTGTEPFLGEDGRLEGDPLRIARLPITSDVNPYQRLLYEHLRGEGIELVGTGDLRPEWLHAHRNDVDVLHFHWNLHRLGVPDLGYRDEPAEAMTDQDLRLAQRRLITGVEVAAQLGYRIIWTMHEPWHFTEGHAFHRWSGRFLAPHCTAIFVHDDEGAGVVRQLGSTVEPTVVRHGNLVGVYPAGRARDEVRRELDIADDAFTFIAFGHMRQDKDLPEVLDAFRRLRDPQVALIVAGRSGGSEVTRTVSRAAQRDARVRFLPQTIPVEQVTELFAASDSAVLARRKLWTSGSLALAMSLGLPVVAVDRPLVRDMAGDSGWFFDIDTPTSLREAMAQAAAAGVDEARGGGEDALQMMLSRHQWSALAETTATAVRGDLVTAVA